MKKLLFFFLLIAHVASAESPNCTTIPIGSDQIVDNIGNVWTLPPGLPQVMKNGGNTNSPSAVKLHYVNRVFYLTRFPDNTGIYIRNEPTNWWDPINAIPACSSDPTPVPVPIVTIGTPIYWDASITTNVISYKFCVDGICTPVGNILFYNLPSLVAGMHDFTVIASNVTGDSPPSAVLRVLYTITASPQPPTNLRVTP